MTKYFIEQGSIYAPGWHVRERVRDNYLVSVARFDEKADAEEYLAFLQEQQVADWLSKLSEPLTRDQRIKAYYLGMAGTYPGPNQAAIAAILAHRLVDIEDAEAGVS